MDSWILIGLGIVMSLALVECGNSYWINIELSPNRWSGTNAAVKARLLKDGNACESPWFNKEHNELATGSSFTIPEFECSEDWRGNIEHVQLKEDGDGVFDNFIVKRIVVSAREGKPLVFSSVGIREENGEVSTEWSSRFNWNAGKGRR